MRSLTLLATTAIRHQQRLFSTSSRVLAGDPVQDLFVQKIREYKQKCVFISLISFICSFCRSAGGKLVDSNPQVEKALNDALAQVANAFNVADPKKAYEF